MHRYRVSANMTMRALVAPFCASLALLSGPLARNATAADLLPAEEVKRLLNEVPIAHGGTLLAIASYRISYTYKGEALEDAAAYGRAMQRRSEQIHGPMLLEKGAVHIEGAIDRRNGVPHCAWRPTIL